MDKTPIIILGIIGAGGLALAAADRARAKATQPPLPQAPAPQPSTPLPGDEPEGILIPDPAAPYTPIYPIPGGD